MSHSVAVVIPTFNRVGPLRRALESVQAQSVRPAEVIVVDDGSDDGTREMLEERFSGVRLLEQPHAGVSAARNRGIAAAVGENEWVAFLDSDDAWLPRKLELQMAALEGGSSERLCHCEEIWIRDGVRVNAGLRHAKSGGDLFEQSLELCLISPSAAVVHRSVFKELGSFDEELAACEDYDFWLRYTASNDVLFVPDPLVVKYGGHADQLSRTVEALDRYRIRSLAKLLDSTPLSAGQRASAIATLLRKIEIYRPGVVKRQRFDEAEALSELAGRFREEARAGSLG